ncbi:TraB/GumN family protein [Paracoccus aurantiacus]|uniref:TraB/GumN family protein n=1 Tax=Paracoccus aurantiacus TaxID=2599412 RepID=A0A5C6S9E6_9RHOB|nr:TraB/GumN family protein [Paracoccus aurantiacus]TXB71157.1 TraB/GumN family protein [Paracoccus aurantiacus]
MKHLLAAVALSFAAPAVSANECVGNNLIDELPAADQQMIRAATDAQPYHEGLLWRATKGPAQITMVGTFHFDLPEHQSMVDRLAPVIAEADTLLVELGPAEEKELQSALQSDPSLTIDTTGPTLPERLSADDWAQVSEVMQERGIPAVMVSRMRPWYLSMMMSISPCMMAEIAKGGGNNGLDWQLMEEAEDTGVPIRALEPWDTVFSMFGDMTPQEELDMIVYSLSAARHADDYAATLTDAYLAEDVWQIWEFGRIDAYRNSGLPRAEVDRLTAEAQVLMMDARNESWIAPLTEAANDAAAKGKGVVAAFGALHLPGEKGVPHLLEMDGWTLERLTK